MGWWRDAQGHVVGDSPADTLSDALTGLQAGARKPSLAVVLGSIGCLLRDHPGRYASDVTNTSFVEAKSGDALVAEAPADAPTLRAVADALDDIASAYQSSEMARLPTASEIVANLGFILAPDPGRFVAGAARPLTLKLRQKT